jgi:membrane-anchored glycerophosphoryl diester phosphodiesterase (GDPDase)
MITRDIFEFSQNKCMADLYANITKGLKVLQKEPVTMVPQLIMAVITAVFMGGAQLLIGITDAAVILGIVGLGLLFFVVASLVFQIATVILCNKAIKSKPDLMKAINESPNYMLQFIGLVLLALAVIIVAVIILAIAGAILLTLFSIMGQEEIGMIIAGILLAAVGVVGFYFLYRLSFANFAIIIDKKGIIESLKYSWKITKGNLLNIFLVVLIATLLSFIPSFLVMIPLTMLNEEVASVLSSFIYTPATVYLVCVNALLYKDLKPAKGKKK